MLSPLRIFHHPMRFLFALCSFILPALILLLTLFILPDLCIQIAND
jgi:hypothetical protein